MDFLVVVRDERDTHSSGFVERRDTALGLHAHADRIGAKLREVAFVMATSLEVGSAHVGMSFPSVQGESPVFYSKVEQVIF